MAEAADHHEVGLAALGLAAQELARAQVGGGERQLDAAAAQRRDQRLAAGGDVGVQLGAQRRVAGDQLVGAGGEAPAELERVDHGDVGAGLGHVDGAGQRTARALGEVGADDDPREAAIGVAWARV